MGGISDPIKVIASGERYKVFEGNTRLSLYKQYARPENLVAGDWSKIKARVYSEIPEKHTDEIRIQDHLVGKTEWKPYAKAHYLRKLLAEGTFNLAHLAATSGMTETKIEESLLTLEMMDGHYKQIIEAGEHTEGEDPHYTFDEEAYTRFESFIRSEKIQSAMVGKATEYDFCKWVAEGRFVKADHVRDNLADILEDEYAFSALRSKTSAEAVQLISSDALNAKLAEAPLVAICEALRNKLEAPNRSEGQRIMDKSAEFLKLKVAHEQLGNYIRELNAIKAENEE